LNKPTARRRLSPGGVEAHQVNYAWYSFSHACVNSGAKIGWPAATCPLSYSHHRMQITEGVLIHQQCSRVWCHSAQMLCLFSLNESLMNGEKEVSSYFFACNNVTLSSTTLKV
jgi:hypothetical protein